ncbi:MAG: hypothetical protein Q7T07_05880 [Burkholderiaceae bacterium]|nr:hypothetical protein [Burkholderiaceae bacterium]
MNSSKFVLYFALFSLLAFPLRQCRIIAGPVIKPAVLAFTASQGRRYHRRQR